MTSAYGNAFTVNGNQTLSQRAISSSMCCQTYVRVISRFRPNSPRTATSTFRIRKTIISLSTINQLQFRQSTKKLQLSLVRQLMSRPAVFASLRSTSSCSPIFWIETDERKHPRLVVDGLDSLKQTLRLGRNENSPKREKTLSNSSNTSCATVEHCTT